MECKCILFVLYYTIFRYYEYNNTVTLTSIKLNLTSYVITKINP